MMSHRENWLRAIEFRSPEWVPFGVGFAPIVWNHFREELEKVLLDYPRIFPGFQAGQSSFFDEMPPVYRPGEHFTDNWGCTWYNAQKGLEGVVVGHPLADWSALETYQPPDLEVLSERGGRDWEGTRAAFATAKEAGGLIGGDGERLFDRMYFLRGFENLMVDIATDDPHLPRLIEMLTEYEMRLIGKWLEMGVDTMGFHTDIGTQHGLMISPAKFRKYIKPMFALIFQTCRAAGSHVCLSSDGNVLEIVDDLIECGISMHDPQLRASTLEGIVSHYKGKVCTTVDMDRQSFPFLTPAEIKDQFRRVMDAMYDPRGGLMISASCWGADVPLRSIAAICEAVEETCFPGG
jgi:uroporphyrinogen decarboxylase